MFFPPPSGHDPFGSQRARMVRVQLEDRGIQDPRILEAMRSVPRHEFVAEEFRDRAYDDHPLPIGCDQTISQPFMVGLMLMLMAREGADRVLEVGTGSGYMTALLSTLCAEVYSIERHAELAASAEQRLVRLGYANVKIKIGDGALGWPEFAPYDAIVVSAAAAEVPPALFAQLREDRRMVVPVGPASTQNLQVVRKVNGQQVVTTVLGCRFVPLVEE